MPSGSCGSFRDGWQNSGCVSTPENGLVPFGKRAAGRALNAGQRPPTMDFLGLTHAWERGRRGLMRLKCDERTLSNLWQAIAHKMRRHFNYFGVADSSPVLWSPSIPYGAGPHEEAHAGKPPAGLL